MSPRCSGSKSSHQCRNRAIAPNRYLSRPLRVPARCTSSRNHDHSPPVPPSQAGVGEDVSGCCQQRLEGEESERSLIFSQANGVTRRGGRLWGQCTSETALAQISRAPYRRARLRRPCLLQPASGLVGGRQIAIVAVEPLRLGVGGQPAPRAWDRWASPAAGADKPTAAGTSDRGLIQLVHDNGCRH